jgi:DNA-binding GntR family transcriptional regulator
VETAPQRFTRVTPLDRRDARDAFPIVAALHALAAELAVPRLTAADLVAMDEANARFAAALRGAARRAGGARGADDAAPGGGAAGTAVDAALAADDAFHGVFLAASANAELPRALDRLMPRIRRLERARFGSLAGRRSVAQHDEIARVAATGDAARSAALVRENWLSLGALIDRTFTEEGT